MNPQNDLEQGKALVVRYLVDAGKAIGSGITEKIGWHQTTEDKDRRRWSLEFQVEGKLESLKFEQSDLEGCPADERVRLRLAEQIRRQLEALVEKSRRAWV